MEQFIQKEIKKLIKSYIKTNNIAYIEELEQFVSYIPRMLQR